MQYFASERDVHAGLQPLGSIQLGQHARASVSGCTITITPRRSRRIVLHAIDAQSAVEMEQRLRKSGAVDDIRDRNRAQQCDHYQENCLRPPDDFCERSSSSRSESDCSDYCPFEIEMDTALNRTPRARENTALAEPDDTAAMPTPIAKSVTEVQPTVTVKVELTPSDGGGEGGGGSMSGAQVDQSESVASFDNVAVSHPHLHTPSPTMDERFEEFMRLAETNKLRHAIMTIVGGVVFDRELARQQFVTAETKQSVLGITWHAVRRVFMVFDDINEDTVATWGLLDVDMAMSSLRGEMTFSLQRSKHGMRWAVQHIVEPVTKEIQLPLLYLLFGIKIDDYAAVGSAKIFHSYTWSESIADTFSTLDKAFSDLRLRFLTPFWWDIFCQNQHIKGDVADTFRMAISQVSNVYFSIPNLSQPLALGRVWCLFEVTKAISTPTTELVFVFNESKYGILQNDVGSYIRDVRMADAFFPADKDMLFALMEKEIPGGCQGVNRIIHDKFAPLLQEQCFRNAIQADDISRVQTMLHQQPSLIKIKSKTKETLLHIASAHNRVKVLEFLLSFGKISIDAMDALQRTPLHAAAIYNGPQACDLLLSRGANIAAVDDDGATPLHWAAVRKHLQVAKVLLKRGADPDAEDLQEQTPSMSAAMAGGKIKALFKRAAQGELSDASSDDDAEESSSNDDSDDDSSGDDGDEEGSKDSEGSDSEEEG